MGSDNSGGRSNILPSAFGPSVIWFGHSAASCFTAGSGNSGPPGCTRLRKRKPIQPMTVGADFFVDLEAALQLSLVELAGKA